jgi:putative acetyltransferase
VAADAMSLRIRPETPADEGAIDRVLQVAFSEGGTRDPSPEVTLVHRLRREAAFDPSLSFVAEQDGEVIGHLLFTPITIRGKTRSWPALSLAPLSVLPGFEPTYAGTRLMREGLDVCREAGHRIVVVLGHPKYYARFGFEPAEVHGIRSPWPTAGAAFRVLGLAPGALEGVSGFVEYPAPFLEA